MTKRLIMISAGEHSGDLHGAALVQEAKKSAPNLEFFGLGGDLLAASGTRLSAHLKDTAVMGLTEVLGSLWRILTIRRNLVALMKSERPAALVLIDSPDFNFYLARVAHGLGIPVIYYICPQIWAWRQGRLKFLKKFVSRRALILPFEVDFYQKNGVETDLVGHPLFDELSLEKKHSELLVGLGYPSSAKLLAILPGSRKKLVQKLLPTMLKAADLVLEKKPNLFLALPRSFALAPEFIDSLVAQAPQRVLDRLRIFDGRSQEILATAETALLASGTSTVEGTILGTPMVVTYKTSSFSWFMAKMLVSVPFISIANLVAGREIIPEILQDKATPKNLAEAILFYLDSETERQKAKKELAEVKQLLGGPGASQKVLKIILEEIQES